jgi:hypothetical protein
MNLNNYNIYPMIPARKSLYSPDKLIIVVNINDLSKLSWDSSEFLY